MRQASKPPSEQISDLRLARLLLWAGLWLERLGGWLEGPIVWSLLAIVERVIGAVVILRAMALAGPPPIRRALHPRGAPPGFRRQHPRGNDFRLALGDAIKRTRRRDPKARIEALNDLIASIGTIIARVARRLARGLGRARLVAIRPPALAFATGASAPDAAYANTS